MLGTDFAGRATVTLVDDVGDGVFYVTAIDDVDTELRWRTETPPTVNEQVRFSIRWTLPG